MANQKSYKTQIRHNGISGDIPIELIWRKRQRRIRLRLDTEVGELKVSSPRGVSKKKLLSFVEKEKEWIKKQWQKFEASTAQVNKEKDTRNNQLYLWGQWWPIKNVPAKGKKPCSTLILRLKNDHVECVSSDESVEIPADFKQQFIRRLAKIYIPERVRARSEAIGLHPNKIFIRSQKTKWGSCSSNDNVNFNWRLVMCPVWIIDYLIIHELCHLRYMNHSRAFWNLVETYYGQRHEAQQWLKQNEFFLFNYP